MRNKFNVKGKSIEDLSGISITEFSQLTRSELSSVVSRLSSAANKRLKRLEKQGIESPAYLAAQKSGGKFSTRGKSLNELRSEYMRVTGFLKAKTSTVRGTKKVRKEMLERIGVSEEDVDDDIIDKMWRVYNEMSGLDAFIQGSGDRQKFIYDVVKDRPDDDIGELINEVENQLTEYYEEQAEYESFDDYFNI